ncbi:hypothetical protein ACLE5P_06810 [Klebsiella pneumoniae]|uniref:hypothetical protein n=1 Tax=Klebsiella pneumoniae TaxID=573 RepID=UPI00232DAA65|nr:hypothetical protein [Klebsiella pneumoniae]MDY1771114.1 hypothetical protein [Klebsiella pneumoniae]MDZ0433462.1 hypothetical protein [Klebsiella pneumoniae]MDZ3098366.1 hypothetical protein [Klebsiella pneumoniae]MDZ3125756.1 hypothetical protein [Klebsiella pneumoniae]
MNVKCLKDTEGYWTEGEIYPARVVAGGFVQVGDDDDPKEGANKQVISSQADSLIKISRIWADFFPANTSNQPI